MGLHDRVSRIVRANLTDMSINSKNPGHDLDHALLDIQASLVKMRQALISATATHQRTQQQYTLALAEVDKWQKRVQLALETEKEELATQALARKKTFIGNAASLKVQLEQQASSVEMLRRNLVAWESKVTEARESRSFLKARVSAVEADARSQKTINGVIADNAVANFEDFEEELTTQPRLKPAEKLDRADLKVLLGEFNEFCNVDAELSKLEEMLGFTNTKSDPVKSLEANHENPYEILAAVNKLERKLQRVLELSQEAFQELATLKTQLQDSHKSQFGSASYNKAIDIELAALKSKLEQL